MAASYWLFKEEPEHYSFAELERDGRTVWEGVVNALARKYLGQVRKGDRILFYHTGKEKAIVGEMKALGDAGPDPAADDPRAMVVEVQPVGRWASPLPLSVIKQDKLLAEWELVRLPRLSVMPVTELQWRRVHELGQSA